jgi:hypothetical protein
MTKRAIGRQPDAHPKARLLAKTEKGASVEPAWRVSKTALECAPMSRRAWLRGIAVTFGIAAAVAAHAHHSWAHYDGDNVITLTGVITAVEWAHPHVLMRFTVGDEAPQPGEWTMEMDPPTLLLRYGMRHDTLAAGMRVTITGVPARSGARMMRAVKIELEDGTVQRVSSRV